MFGRRLTITLLVVYLSSAFSSITNAHEGHGTHGDGNSPTHYLTEPFHLLQFAVLALAVLALGSMVLAWMAKDRSLNRTSSQSNKSE